MLAHFSIAEKQKQQALGSQKAGWGRGREGGDIWNPVSSTRAQVAQLVSSSDHDNKICLQYSILSFKNSHSRPSPSFPPLAVQKAGPESCKPDPPLSFPPLAVQKAGPGSCKGQEAWQGGLRTRVVRKGFFHAKDWIKRHRNSLWQFQVHVNYYRLLGVAFQVFQIQTIHMQV